MSAMARSAELASAKRMNPNPLHSPVLFRLLRRRWTTGPAASKASRTSSSATSGANPPMKTSHAAASDPFPSSSKSFLSKAVTLRQTSAQRPTSALDIALKTCWSLTLRAQRRLHCPCHQFVHLSRVHVPRPLLLKQKRAQPAPYL